MNKELDLETLKLAEQALLNAYWEDFSALVNSYLLAANGLDTNLLRLRMGEASSVYGVHDDAPGFPLDICTTLYGGETQGYTTLYDALSCKDATQVWVRGKRVFELRDGEWYFVWEAICTTE